MSQDLTQAIVSDQEGINRVMEQGQRMRTVGATAMNETSSRSHSIFTIVVEMNDMDDAGKDHIRVGKVGLSYIHCAREHEPTPSGCSLLVRARTPTIYGIRKKAPRSYDKIYDCLY